MGEGDPEPVGTETEGKEEEDRTGLRSDRTGRECEKSGCFHDVKLQQAARVRA